MGLPPSSSQEPVGVADTSATVHRFAMLSLGWRRSFKGSWSFEKRADRWGSLQVARKSQLESPTHLPRSLRATSYCDRLLAPKDGSTPARRVILFSQSVSS